MTICKGVSLYTGKPCNHKAVNQYTVNKKSGEFLDPNYCQMHQPGKESSKKCTCKYCAYHRSKEAYAKVVTKTPAPVRKVTEPKTQIQTYCETLLKK